MNKDVAIASLRKREQSLREHGAASLYLFGSTARDEAKETSDLDLFIDQDLTRKFSLFDLVGLQQLLERELGVPVDLTTRGSLHPKLKPAIEAEAIRVF